MLLKKNCSFHLVCEFLSGLFDTWLVKLWTKMNQSTIKKLIDTALKTSSIKGEKGSGKNDRVSKSSFLCSACYGVTFSMVFCILKLQWQANYWSWGMEQKTYNWCMLRKDDIMVLGTNKLLLTIKWLECLLWSSDIAMHIRTMIWGGGGIEAGWKG